MSKDDQFNPKYQTYQKATEYRFDEVEDEGVAAKRQVRNYSNTAYVFEGDDIADEAPATQKTDAPVTSFLAKLQSRNNPESSANYTFSSFRERLQVQPQASKQGQSTRDFYY